MNKRIKNVIFVGIIVVLMSIFASPILATTIVGSPCNEPDGTVYCENAALLECYNKVWEDGGPCDFGTCTLDNSRCADESEANIILNEFDVMVSMSRYCQDKSDGTEYCFDGVFVNCKNKLPENMKKCESGMCMPDNSRCANIGGEADTINNVLTALNGIMSCDSNNKTKYRCVNAKLWRCNGERWMYIRDCECMSDNSGCFSVYNVNSMAERKTTSDLTEEYNPTTSSSLIPSYPFGFKFADKDVASIFNELLPYIYVFAGLILLFMMIFGGIGLMTAAGDPKKMEASQKRITMALVGFLIVFVSYFVVQIVEVVLGIKIL